MKVLDKPTRRRFSAEEYYRMGKTGIIADGARVELIDGEVIDMVPVGGRHARRVDRLTGLFVRTFADVAVVRIQNPLRLSDRSEPQPDLTLVRREFYAQDQKPHPGPADVFLVTEVADSTADFDLGVKALLYAASGVREYWIIDLSANTILIHRQPGPKGYADIRQPKRGDRLAIDAFPEMAFKAEDLLTD